MLYDKLNAWRLLHPAGDVPRVALVLHTSCVSYPLTELKDAAALNYQWIIPDDVYHELLLLKESRYFGPRASFILSKARSTASAAWPELRRNWDLEELYSSTHGASLLPSGIFAGTMLFVFGDLSKLEEFLSAVPAYSSHYVLLHTGWSCTNCDAQILPLKTVTGRKLRSAHPLSPGQPVPKLQSIPQLRLEGPNTQYRMIRCSSFTSTDKPSGSYANICASADCPGKLLKVYKHATASGSTLNKLVYLKRLSQGLSDNRLALPDELLMHNGQALGFTMVPCQGRKIFEYISTGNWPGDLLGKVLRNLALLLLELHCLHMMANDLSFNNVLVDGTGRVCLVDCDSFQVCGYPGGKITPLYQHPEIDAQHCNDTLRLPKHECFAYAVLAYQCIFNCQNPVMQKQHTLEADELTWSNTKFPLEAEVTVSDKVNANMLSSWLEQPLAVRKAFADEFHFRRPHSLGFWIRELELLS